MCGNYLIGSYRNFFYASPVKKVCSFVVHTSWSILRKKPTSLYTIEWAKEVVNRGAGELLLTSMENDGTKKGFAIDITRQVSTSVHVPVIASGGAGNPEHFADVFVLASADAALAASIFHFREIAIPDLKHFLKLQQIPVRL